MKYKEGQMRLEATIAGPDAVGVWTMGKIALISLTDKSGAADFAKELVGLGYEIVSTGGTANVLRAAGLAVTDISELTGFPECLDGRVKTLHPAVHAGILARQVEEHLKQVAKLGIRLIDIVCVNLYPFQATVDRGAGFEEIVENIDIGGPSMLRSAAKNFERVTVITDPSDYERVLRELRSGKVSKALKLQLAAKAFSHTAAYDAAISQQLNSRAGRGALDLASGSFAIGLAPAMELRYGENPHQGGGLYRSSGLLPSGMLAVRKLSGKELSYNNLGDMDTAIAVLREFGPDRPCVCIVKHATPCGVAVAGDIEEAYRLAYEADPVSAFGGIVAANRPLGADVIGRMAEIFLEVVVAPGFTGEAVQMFSKKPSVRFVELPLAEMMRDKEIELKAVPGGYLMQGADLKRVVAGDLRCVTKAHPSDEEIEQLLMAWKVVKHVKSNAILLWRGEATVGVGGGQTNRVGAARIAIEVAGEKARGSVMASDAFFPFKDTVEAAVKAGVKAIIQPGGSIRDKESIEECDRNGIAMVFTGVRHFKH